MENLEGILIEQYFEIFNYKQDLNEQSQEWKEVCLSSLKFLDKKWRDEIKLIIKAIDTAEERNLQITQKGFKTMLENILYTN